MLENALGAGVADKAGQNSRSSSKSKPLLASNLAWQAEEKELARLLVVEAGEEAPSAEAAAEAAAGPEEEDR